MAPLPRGFDPVAAEAYVSVPMTFQERLNFEKSMLDIPNLNASIWNPLNPRGKCYDPHYETRRSNAATVVIAKPGPVFKMLSPAPSKLNPKAASFDGSRSPPADQNLRVQVQIRAQPVSIDSDENKNRWAQFLSYDPPKLHATPTPTSDETMPIVHPSTTIEVQQTSPVETAQFATPSRPPIIESKEAALCIPTQIAFAISPASITQASPVLQPQIISPNIFHTTMETTAIVSPNLPAAASASVKHVSTGNSPTTTTDANIQDVWSAWMNARKMPAKADEPFPSTSAVISTKDTVAADFHRKASAEILSAVPVATAIQDEASIKLEVDDALTVTHTREVQPVFSSIDLMNTPAIKKGHETAALDASSAASLELCIARNYSEESFNRDPYREHLHDVTPKGSRMNDFTCSASPTLSKKSNVSGQSANMDHIATPVQSINSAWRHPMSNPKFKIDEDSSTFIAHIKNGTRAGKTYTKKKKENVPIVEISPSKISPKTLPRGPYQDSTFIYANTQLPFESSAIEPASGILNLEKATDGLVPQNLLSEPRGLVSALPVKSALKSVFSTSVQNEKFGEVLKDAVTKPKMSVSFKEASHVGSPPQTSQDASTWQLHPALLDILSESSKFAQWLSTLTEASDLANTEVQPSGDAFDDDKVSNDGVSDIRALNGNNAHDQLQDWDGSWGPAPCDWEAGRPFDDTFVPEYIKEWVKQSPAGPSVKVDADAIEFILGEHPVSNACFGSPVHQPETIPDTVNSTDEKKRLAQTSQNALDGHNHKAVKKQEHENSWRRAQELRYQEIDRQIMEGTPDLFAPAIDMYVRPAELKDAAAIRDIYNYYVVNTIIPEDQTEISLEVAQNLIRYAQREKLPLVVAVQGKLSPVNTANKPQGRRAQSQPQKVLLPEKENLIGFASTEHASFGLFGSPYGLHRFTTDLKIYIDIEYTRKGVGRNLLDHLIHILHFGYAFRNSCRFVNQNNDPVYETGGSGPWHMMNFRIPALKQHDTTFPWVCRWLKNRFKFLPGGCLKSWGRTAIKQGPARFVDVHIIQCEALQEADVDVNF